MKQVSFAFSFRKSDSLDDCAIGLWQSLHARPRSSCVEPVQ